MRQLSLGPSAGGRVTAVVLTVMVMCLSSVVVGIAALLGSLATGGGDDLTPAGLVCGAVFGIALYAFYAFLLLRVLRTAYWLEGTTVVNRRALTTRRIDLATAEVSGDALTVMIGQPGHRHPVTVRTVRARDPRSGLVIDLPLTGRGLKRLPAAELHAIADAIMAGRLPGDPVYATAEALARAIREIAADPFPV